MFRKILFPIHGDELDENDFKIVIDVAEKYDGEIFLLTVSEIYHTGLSDLNVPEELFEQHKKLLTEYLEKIAEKFKDKGFKVTVAIREGTPYREIVDYAEEINAGLIIIPTHGRSGLPAFILGSVSQKVVKFAKCPVLTFRPDLKEEYINEWIGKFYS